MNLRAISESLTCGRVLDFGTFSDKTHSALMPEARVFGTGRVSDFYEIFCEQIEKTCKNKKKIGLALSGGKDSRVILTALLDLNIKPECVSWSFKKEDPEVQTAIKICDKFNLKHKFVKISPEMYFNPENEQVLIELADGSPLYFDMMLWYGIKDKLKHDVLFCGNLMTEYMDTAEYRIYEGLDVNKALLDKETILPFSETYDVVVKDLIDFYFDNPLPQVITHRMLDRITQYHVMKNFINWDYPILNNRVLSELYALPLRMRKGSKLTRSILKEHNPTLYKLPTGRSPFSLRYPLIMHQAWQKLSKRKISKGLEHLLPPLMTQNETDLKGLADYDFINEERLLDFLKNEKGRTYRIGMSRLLNLQRWLKYNGESINSK